jgi:hypothetical protein
VDASMTLPSGNFFSIDGQTARTGHVWRPSKALELPAHVYESYRPCVSRVTLLALLNMLRH